MILVNVVILKVEIHYYGRLAAKQGWRFDSTYDHKDENGDPNPFVFVLGSGKVSLIINGKFVLAIWRLTNMLLN